MRTAPEEGSGGRAILRSAKMKNDAKHRNLIGRLAFSFSCGISERPGAEGSMPQRVA